MVPLKPGSTPLILPMPASHEKPDFTEKSIDSYKQMFKDTRLTFETWISLIDSGRVRSCTSSSGQARPSRSLQYGYRVTIADLVSDFKLLSEMLSCYDVNREDVQLALQQVFLSMCNGPTLEALGNLSEVPAGLRSIMTRFLAYMNHLAVENKLKLEQKAQLEVARTNLAEALNRMKIETPFLKMVSRTFTWIDRGVRMAASGKLPRSHTGDVKQYSGKPIPPKSEPKSALDDGILTIYEYKAKETEMVCWYWCLKLSEDGLLIAQGDATSLEDAADAIYRAFYRSVTKKRTADATLVQKGTQLVVVGNWITNEEYLNYKFKDNLQVVVDANHDERGTAEDQQIFVVNWPKLGKDKALVVAQHVKRARNYGTASADNVIVELASGFTLDSCLDWYVYHSEQYMLGEAMCMKCGQVGDVGNMLSHVVRGIGFHCGPCCDVLIDQNLVDPFQMDLTAIL